MKYFCFLKKTSPRGVSFLFVFLFVCVSGVAQEGLINGLIWDDTEYNRQPLKIDYDKKVQGLPPAFSVKKFCPPVINQGTSNTAVVWATVWYARTLLRSVACDKADNIFQHSYNGFFNHRLLTDNCAKPVSLALLLASLKLKGTKKFEEYNEVCPDSIGQKIIESAGEHRISGFVRLFHTFDKKEIKVNAIKASLHAGNSVVVGVINKQSLAIAKEVWQISEQRDRGQGGHALCVVGYDDTKFGGAFEVVNSWGKSWGNAGFTWIKYEDVQEAFVYGYEMFDTRNNGCADSGMEAHVQFIQTNGNVMPAAAIEPGRYEFTKVYPTKTEFRVKINTTHRMYIYGFFADSTNAVFTFLPMAGHPFTNASTQPKQEITLPFGGLPFTLEPPIGANHLAFIFSATELNETTLAHAIVEGKGNFQQRMKAISKDWKFPTSLVWNNDMKFSAGYEKDFIVVMTVRLDQSD